MFTNFETYATGSSASLLVMSVCTGQARQQYQTAPGDVPITSTGSLQFQCVSATESVKGNIRPASSQSWRGLPRGEIITLFEDFVDSQKPSAGVFAFGIYGMADRADLTSGVGKCYAACFHSSGATIQILKFSSGVTASNITQSGVSVLASFAASQAWPSNTVNAAGFSWRVSGTTVDLQAKLGFSTSLYNMSAWLTATDYTSAYISTVGEGLWIHSVTRQWAQVYWDSTRFAQVV
jgi:hypothetical protein